MLITIEQINETELSEDFKNACSAAEKELAEIVEKDTRPYVPYKTGTFMSKTTVSGNVVTYNGPQVGYLWYGNRMVNAATGKGPRYIKDVGWRWPKGAKLRPTSDPLHYTKTPHKLAGAKWVERAEKDHSDEWVKKMEEVIDGNLSK